MYKRELDPFGLGKMTILYTECEHTATDNEITVYQDYKISIHLTDGLFGVLDDRLVGGKTGDVSLYAPDEVHFGRFSKAGKYRFVTLLLSYELLKNIETEFPCVFMFSGRTNCIRGSLDQKACVLEIAEKLAEISQQNENSDGIKSFALLSELLLLCSELYLRPQKEVSCPYGNHFVQRAIELIAKKYSEEITVSELGKEVGCSTVYLSKCFKMHTGCTVHRYLTEYRISKAAALLSVGASVTEACFAVGFSDCSSFIRTFSCIMKTTPYKFKMQHK